MHVRAQYIDSHVHRMANDKHDDESDRSQDPIPEHRTHLIDDRCDNSCRKSQSQKTGVRKHITQPARHIIDIVRSKRKPERRILIVPARHEQKPYRANDRQRLCQCVQNRREHDLSLRNGREDIAWDQHQDQTDQEYIPQDYITDKVFYISIFQTHISFDPVPYKKVDQSKQH